MNASINQCETRSIDTTQTAEKILYARLQHLKMSHVSVVERMSAVRAALSSRLIDPSRVGRANVKALVELVDEHYRQLGVHSKAGDDADWDD